MCVKASPLTGRLLLELKDPHCVVKYWSNLAEQFGFLLTDVWSDRNTAILLMKATIYMRTRDVPPQMFLTCRLQHPNQQSRCCCPVANSRLHWYFGLPYQQTEVATSIQGRRGFKEGDRRKIELRWTIPHTCCKHASAQRILCCWLWLLTVLRWSLFLAFSIFSAVSASFSLASRNWARTCIQRFSLIDACRACPGALLLLPLGPMALERDKSLIKLVVSSMLPFAPRLVFSKSIVWIEVQHCTTNHVVQFFCCNVCVRFPFCTTSTKQNNATKHADRNLAPFPRFSNDTVCTGPVAWIH